MGTILAPVILTAYGAATATRPRGSTGRSAAVLARSAEIPAAILERRVTRGRGVWWVLMYSSSSGRNLARTFLTGQAAPSARPQIVVPGVMPHVVRPSGKRMSRSSIRPPPCLDPLDRLVHPGGPLAAGGALAAALVGEEAGGVVEVVDHAGLVVHHGHRGGAEAEAAGLAKSLEVERRVELVGREQAHADPAGDRGLGLPALPDAAGMFVDQRRGRSRPAASSTHTCLLT